MAIDDEFVPDNICAYQLVSFADDLGLSTAVLSTNLSHIVSKIQQSMKEVIALLPEIDTQEQRFVAEYSRQILARCRRYLDMLPDITKMVI